MPQTPTVGEALANDIVDRVEDLLLEAEQAGEPVEIDPHRGRLFELFVMADAAGFLLDDSEQDLSSEGIARQLALRWDLAAALTHGLSQPSKLPPTQFAKVRLLWAFMRMWMEWSYAWKRWDEFHQSSNPAAPE